MAILEEVQACGGAPILNSKGENAWGKVVKKLRTSGGLMKVLGGRPSEDVIKSVLTAYRYIGQPIAYMLESNDPQTGGGNPAEAMIRVQELEEAVIEFCTPYELLEAVNGNPSSLRPAIASLLQY